jgi:hypothetical protein
LSTIIDSSPPGYRQARQELHRIAGSGSLKKGETFLGIEVRYIRVGKRVDPMLARHTPLFSLQFGDGIMIGKIRKSIPYLACR